ncbi:phage holin [Lactococcus petauri]|uniref:phage holin n=1 Tax=Lactococcus TaxID=1357 RepID=UPI0013FE3EFA|nr:phage holin [Lactococcus petauri]MDQ7119802.1 phage holin [Lactococcus petauri]MDQ7125337.1 phage holin [Lactococcus petauri]MDQ7126316.1 phage holin [Lactococcus petauri]MDQ7128223.1 phage holin [Lactococcus petauri]MDQ7138057.1 phage holin [Lactococcus petauri]
MNKINWEVRLKSKTFWLAAVPAFLLLAQTIGAPFGYKWDFVVLNQQLAAIINAAFGLLAIIGVVVDPTTAGIKDSQRVMEKLEDNK